MYMMYVGMLNECMKAEFPRLIRRGVPFEVPPMFEDLFKSDPLYVLVDDEEAKGRLEDVRGAPDQEIGLDMAQLAIDDHKEDIEAGLKAWMQRRDEHRKKLLAQAAEQKEPTIEGPPVKIIPKGW